MPNRRTIAGIALLLAAAAAAQDNAVKSAADAFGERVGTEQSGLYTESQVRGFDLNDSGGYRIDDAYFSRAAVLNDPVLAGVGVRVGVNAVRLAYPAPSGVVNYRLREAGPTDEVRLGMGFRDFGTQVIQADVSLRAGAFGFAGGAVWRPVWRLAQGNEGGGLDVGGVGAWKISSGQRLRAFATVYERRYDGDYAIVPAESAVPPNVRSLHNYSPSWAFTTGTSSNFGVLYDGKIGGYEIDVSAFRSIFDVQHADYTVISAGADGIASATTYRYPRRPKISDSAELRVGRQFDAGGLDHLATVSLRAGRTSVSLTTNPATVLGSFDLRHGDPADVAPIDGTGPRGRDSVDQVTASVGYGVAWKERLQLRAAIHRTRYDKDFLSVAGVQSDRITETTQFDSSAVVGLGERTALFASWVTGLEEAGVAPATAANRDEVLAPVEAEQFELGVRHVLSPGLTLIGAVFDVSKPTNGFRADRTFGLVGEVRHRGIEGSIAGQLGDRTHVVVGVVAFESDVSGELVDAGIVGSRAAGISHLIATANVERKLPKGWSIDAAVSHAGERWADTANTFRTPAVTLLNVGARRRFALAGRPAEFRVLGSNLTGVGGYTATRSGVLAPIPPRTVRALLTVSLGLER